jgi:hypothetical protein
VGRPKLGVTDAPLVGDALVAAVDLVADEVRAAVRSI